MFENEHFVAVDKEAGWLTIPGRLGAQDPRPILVEALSLQLQQKVFVIHRLDADVSGLVLFAKDANAHRQASLWFEKHSIAKTYQAFTEVHTPVKVGDRFVWQDKLVRGKKRTFIAEHGKESRTDATCTDIQQYRNHAVAGWSLMPLTGRTHQLRVHLSSQGFPILGDSLYGSRLAWSSLKGIALRNFSLLFQACQEAANLGLPREIQVPELVVNELAK